MSASLGKVCMCVGDDAMAPNEDGVICCQTRSKVDYGSGAGALAHAGCGRMCAARGNVEVGELGIGDINRDATASGH